MSPDRGTRNTRELETPKTRRRRLALQLDSDLVGVYSEKLARFLGTGRYLAIQTVIVVAWIVLNLAAVATQWDPYPFILLNLAFSTQAAYAAPLILLAQNRQETRDRIVIEDDRMRAEQTKADTEFLARELAAVRIALGDAVTRDYLRRELDDLMTELTDKLRESLAESFADRQPPRLDEPHTDRPHADSRYKPGEDSAEQVKRSRDS